jgi:hypothetical protein
MVKQMDSEKIVMEKAKDLGLSDYVSIGSLFVIVVVLAILLVQQRDITDKNYQIDKLALINTNQTQIISNLQNSYVILNNDSQTCMAAYRKCATSNLSMQIRGDCVTLGQAMIVGQLCAENATALMGRYKNVNCSAVPNDIRLIQAKCAST